MQQAYGYTAVPTLDSAVDASMPAPGVSLDFAREYGNSIQSRYAAGPLGRGWFTPWQTKLVNTNNGDLVQIVGEAGSARTFQRDTRTGGYFSGTGDSATLTALGGGVFELRSVSGTVTRFRADGKLDSVRDTNGNKVTAGYNGSGRLSSLTHTSGASLAFAYNAAGLIASVTDSAGRATAYGYDATNTYLTTVTTADGKVTRYTYQTAGAVQVKHALLSVERGGTTQFFDYDARGRLDDSHLTGNAQFVDYAYSDTGLVTVSDAAGTTRLYFDYHGLLAKTADPLGNLTSNEFNSDLRLSKTVGATGESQSFAWSAGGSLSAVTNELGQTTTFAYNNALQRLTGFTDARGNITTYTYDAAGNLLTTVYPNGLAESLGGYTAAGLPGASTNRRGQTLSYTYNAAGQVTRQTFANNTFITFAYDARGNLTTVTDGSQVTTYTYNYAVDGDRLKRITYPNGRYLDYLYDSFGRRTRMTDQDGYQTRYEYDTAGRLYRLRDASDALLVTYTYDPSGRLSRVDKGNGTFTTYDYDAAGQLLSLKNWRNATTLNSKFDYIYDSRGRRVTQATLDGTWTYGYDGTGQLTRAVFASLNTAAIPNQDLQYFYDAAGNRTKTVLNGVTTLYAANNLNQYTSVGGVGQTYDADGNLTFDGVNAYTWDQQSRLVSVSGPQGVTQYEYDAFGNRVAKAENGVRTEYINDSELGIATVTVGTYSASQQLVSRSVYGSGLIFTGDTSSTSYYDFDGVGNATNTTSVAGILSSANFYDPFGRRVLGSSPTAMTFNGLWGAASSANGLTHMGVREYSSTTGRFLSNDPIALSGGDYNLSRFAGNNPISQVDPSGNGYFESSSTISWVGHWQYHYDNGNTVGFYPNDVAWWPYLVGVPAHLQPGNGSTWYRISGYYDDASIDSIIQNKQIDYWMNYTLLLHDCHGWATALMAEYQKRVGLPSRSPLNGGPSGGDLLPGFVVRVPNTIDPNQKLPGSGFGPLSFVAAGGAIPYRIDFENDATATAPAQYVTVSDFLSANFDWATFRLTDFGFGNTVVTVPPNAQSFQTTVHVTVNGRTFDVLISAGIRTATGEVYASFQSLDPATGLPPDVLVGFLAPEDGTGRGMGHLGYTVRAKAGLATGTEIRNVALISFDGQSAIATDQVAPHDPSQGVDPAKQARVTLDAGLPTSTVAALPATTTTAAFTVSWSGADDAGGSGLTGYDVYMSVNGAAFTRWLTNTVLTSATFTGAFDNAYRFYSVAIDNAGQRQPTPAAQASTQLIDPRGTSVIVSSSAMTSSVYGQSVTFTVMVSPLLPGNPTPTGTAQFKVDGVALGGPVTLSGGLAYVTTATLAAGFRAVTAAYTSDAGNYDPTTSAAYTQAVAQAPLTVTADDKTKVAGDPVPPLTATYVGFVNGDGVASLSGQPALSVPGSAVNTAGNFAITAAAGTLAAPNYAFSFVNGTLRVTPAAVATVTVVAGSPQSAVVGSAFATPLRVAVTDAYGNAEPGVSVTFTAPASGPGGTFAGGSAGITVAADANGQAAAPVFTANLAVGAYALTAATAGKSAGFALTNAAPAVQSVAVNGGAAQRSRVTTADVTFTAPVTLAAGAFTWTRQSDGGAVSDGGANPQVVVTTATVGGQTVATLTFLPTTAASGLVEYGSLADGVWVLSVDRTKVTVQGVPMAADFATPATGVGRVTRLFGDSNGDGATDTADLFQFRRAFNGAVAYNPAFDFNGDGVVDTADLFQFRKRFNGPSLP